MNDANNPLHSSGGAMQQADGFGRAKAMLVSVGATAGDPAQLGGVE